VDHSESTARTGHILCALVCDDGLSRVATSASREFEKISAETLRSQFAAITTDSGEASEQTTAPSDSPQRSGKPGGPTKTPALDQYTIDLTDAARAGKIDPVLGRDPEIRQMIDVLTRRRQNNPILTGEAGVGKTAVVEGFALRLASGDVPPSLQNVSLRSLDM